MGSRPINRPPMPILGSELLTERRRLNLSQHGLAVRLGVSTASISRWEAEERSCPPWISLALRAVEADLIRDELARQQRRKERAQANEWGEGEDE